MLSVEKHLRCREYSSLLREIIQHMTDSPYFKIFSISTPSGFLVEGYIINLSIKAVFEPFNSPFLLWNYYSYLNLTLT